MPCFCGEEFLLKLSWGSEVWKPWCWLADSGTFPLKPKVVLNWPGLMACCSDFAIKGFGVVSWMTEDLLAFELAALISPEELESLNGWAGWSCGYPGIANSLWTGV